MVDQLSSYDYGLLLEKSLPFLLLTEIKIIILKRNILKPLAIRDFFPYFKVANLSFTHLYTTTTYFNLYIKLISRSISMCQVLGQCSVRAIIKLFIFNFMIYIRYIYNEVYFYLYIFFSVYVTN